MEDEDFNTVGFSSDITDINTTRYQGYSSPSCPILRTTKSRPPASTEDPDSFLWTVHFRNHQLPHFRPSTFTQPKIKILATPPSEDNLFWPFSTSLWKIFCGNSVILDQLFIISSHVMSTNYWRLGKLDFLNNS